MITGLTAPIVEDDATFEHFLWTCATRFTQHDRGFDTVYVGFEENTHEADRLAKLRAELEDILVMSDEGYAKHRAAEIETARVTLKEINGKREAELVPIAAMLNRVEAWTPPDERYTALKGLMLDQLKMVYEGNKEPYVGWVAGGPESREKKLSQLHEQVREDEGRLRKAQETRAERTKWVADLRAAVPIPDTKEIVDPSKKENATND